MLILVVCALYGCFSNLCKQDLTSRGTVSKENSGKKKKSYNWEYTVIAIKLYQYDLHPLKHLSKMTNCHPIF